MMRGQREFGMRVFNVRLHKVGGIWFLHLGRIHFSFCVSRVLTDATRGE